MENYQTPDNLHLGNEKLTGSYRAPRISDGEWDRWREKVVHLYIEENMSRKELVEAMTKEHGFSITEKQLKHRLQKWGIKKYLDAEDRQTLLSLKRKRGNVDKDPVLEYRGHVIDSERLKRIYKRSKGPIASPLMASSHIKAIGTPSPSPPLFEAGVSVNKADSVTPLPLMSEAGFLQPEDLEVRNAMNTTLEVALDAFQEDITDRNHLGASQALWDSVYARMMESFDDPNLGLNHLQSWDNHDLETEWHNVSEEDIRSTMAYIPDISNNLSSLIDLSSSVDHGLNVTDLEFVSPLTSARTPRSVSHFGILHSQATTSTNYHRSCGSHSRITRKAAAYEQDLDTAILFGTDPEMVIMPLLLLQKAVSAIPEASMHKARYCCGSIRRNLANMVDFDWLRSEIESLVCLGHEAASNSIRQRQALKASRESSKSSRLVEEHSNNMLTPLTNAPRSKGFDTFVHDLPSGKVRVRLSLVSIERSDYVDGELSYEAQVYFVPNPHICTTGVSALFSRLNKTQSSVPAQITTFNVVPQDAQIIRCVRTGDITGVRKLFETKQASARDVDPGGFSLLSYATDPKCFDVFRLLIESGAGTENCKVYGHSMSILWVLWQFLMSGIIFPDLFNSLSLDHCKSLSNIAIKKGCDFEDSRSYNDIYPNLLFYAELADYAVLAHDGRNLSSTDSIDIFLDYGCCIEQKNCDGMTPFLFTASKFWRIGAVSRIKAFLRRRAHSHVIDNRGGGALHVVLWATKRNWFHTKDNLPGRYLGELDYYFCGDGGSVAGVCDDLESAFYEDLDTMQMRSERADRSGIGIRVEDHHAEPLDSDNNSSYGTGSDGTDSDGTGSDDDDSDGDDNDGEGSDGGGSDGDWSLAEFLRLYRIFQLRLRLMLFELLQAGCDPNLLDFKGKSPSHYGQHDKLWRHWSWALKHTGYVYEESSDAWVKPSQFDEMLEEMAMTPFATAGDRSGLDTVE
ncbi:hypothetical protein MMC27_003405 [Xylographa pallens]|nr:hypothetical protein [Xylographa pallens]